LQDAIGEALKPNAHGVLSKADYEQVRLKCSDLRSAAHWRFTLEERGASLVLAWIFFARCCAGST
jgi:hypothetical protein